MNRPHHVKYGEEEEEVVEGLVDCLGGEDDEGEDVANQSKTSNGGEEHTFHKEGKCVQPWSWCWRKLILKNK